MISREKDFSLEIKRHNHEASCFLLCKIECSLFYRALLQKRPIISFDASCFQISL